MTAKLEAAGSADAGTGGVTAGATTAAGAGATAAEGASVGATAADARAGSRERIGRQLASAGPTAAVIGSIRWCCHRAPAENPKPAMAAILIRPPSHDVEADLLAVRFPERDGFVGRGTVSVGVESLNQGDRRRVPVGVGMVTNDVGTPA